MKRTVLALLLAASVAVGVAVADEPKAVTFAKADLGKVPAGWKAAQTGKGASAWKVVEDKTAPSKSGFALAQTTDDRDALFDEGVEAGAHVLLEAVEDARLEDLAPEALVGRQGAAGALAGADQQVDAADAGEAAQDFLDQRLAEEAGGARDE